MTDLRWWLVIQFVMLAYAWPTANSQDLAFQWNASRPRITASSYPDLDTYSIKDPTVVRFQDRWHLFCTIRGKQTSHGIVYLNFADWDQAATAPQTRLRMHPHYFCAPQVFYYEPQQRWYLICQASDPAWSPNYQPAFSTTTTLDDPTSWAPLQPLIGHKPGNLKGWIDFWIICDDHHAHLFFTSNDGNFWRCETPRDHFPRGWSEPVLALHDDLFEASHTYKLKDKHQFVTIVEAQHGNGWRYYKAYIADSLHGPWKALAASRAQPFAAISNVTQPEPRWTDSISHGEFLRSGINERLEIDSVNAPLLFQGVLETERQGKPYGEIPWRLGLLHNP